MNKDNYLNNLNFNLNKNIDNTFKPKLIEPNVKFFLKNILKQCHTYKMKNYNLYYNISLFVIFISILGILLYTRYKGNINSQERYIKQMKDKEYIMSKLVYYNRVDIENSQKIKNNMITNLPDYSNHPEANLLHKKIYF